MSGACVIGAVRQAVDTSRVGRNDGAAKGGDDQTASVATGPLLEGREGASVRAGVLVRNLITFGKKRTKRCNSPSSARIPNDLAPSDRYLPLTHVPNVRLPLERMITAHL